LNLFRASTGRIAEPDVPLAQGMAGIAAIALLQERAVRSHVLTVFRCDACPPTDLQIPRSITPLCEVACKYESFYSERPLERLGTHINQIRWLSLD
jgi:hypothetical protein